ncbi:MAG: hypothetical protein WC959_04285 [Kiritimatiellales bacterium]
MAKLRATIACFLQNDLLKHSSLLFSGMMIVNLCNLTFQMAVSRALPDAEYALLAAFLGILAIISYPLATLITGLGHYSSLLAQENRAGDIKRLTRKWLVLTGIPALLSGAGIILFNETISGWMHLERAAPVVIAGITLPALFWLPVLTGAAQGLQLFGWASAASISGAVFRFLFGAGLVIFWVPACGWAMVGHGAGLYISAGVLMAALLLVLRRAPATNSALPGMRFYLLQSFFIQTAFAVLMNADVVLVKHFLPAETEFAYAATLGRTVAFIPAVIAVAMFPKVVSDKHATAEHRKIFLQSFGYTALLVSAALIGCLLFPRLLLRILFGIRTASPSIILLTRLMAIAMSFSALVNTIIQFLLAQRRFFAALPVLFCCGSYLLAVYLWHDHINNIAAFSAALNAIALITGLRAIFRLRGFDA